MVWVRSGYGLAFEELDILIGGSEHDLLDAERQNQLIAQIEEGAYDLILLSPPCGSWSRANWRKGRGPNKPCRSRGLVSAIAGLALSLGFSDHQSELGQFKQPGVGKCGSFVEA